jgi:hypothetical protein
MGATTWCGAWGWGSSVGWPHSLHTAEATGPSKPKLFIVFTIDANPPFIQTWIESMSQQNAGKLEPPAPT